MDMWSFRLANLVVGNDEGAPGLEAQFMGPTIRFERAGVIAVTGANMRPILDGQPIPMWESVAVEAGQTLVMGPAVAGARGYLAVAGGINAPQWLGSASTFHKAGVGGLDGHAVQAGQVLPVKEAAGTPGRQGRGARAAGLPRAARPGRSKRYGAPTTTGSTTPATTVSPRRHGCSKRGATAPAIGSGGRTGPSRRRPPTSCPSTAIFRPTSSIRAIRWVR